MTTRTLGLLAALVAGAVVLIMLTHGEQYRSTAQIACAAIKASAENLQHALEVCHENGILRLPGD